MLLLNLTGKNQKLSNNWNSIHAYSYKKNKKKNILHQTEFQCWHHCICIFQFPSTKNTVHWMMFRINFFVKIKCVPIVFCVCSVAIYVTGKRLHVFTPVVYVEFRVHTMTATDKRFYLWPIHTCVFFHVFWNTIKNTLWFEKSVNCQWTTRKSHIFSFFFHVNPWNRVLPIFYT